MTHIVKTHTQNITHTHTVYFIFFYRSRNYNKGRQYNSILLLHAQIILSHKVIPLRADDDNVLQQCTSIKQVKKQLLHIILPTYLKDALTLHTAFTSTLTLLTSHGQRTKIIYPVQTLAVVLLSYKLHHRNISFKCVRIKEQP